MTKQDIAGYSLLYGDMSSFNLTKTDKRGQIMRYYDSVRQILITGDNSYETPISWDNYGNSIYVGSIVSRGDVPEESDIADILYQIVGNDVMSGMTEIMELSDYIVQRPEIGGQTLEYAVIYAMPVISIECWKLLQIYA